MAWFAQAYVAPISYEPVGPRAFPMVLAALLGVGGLWLALRPGAKAKAEARQTSQLKSLGLAVAAVFAYALLFERLGFTLATALMALPVGMAFGGSWKQALASGLGLGLAFYLLFDKLLDVVLPTGWLSFIFGGR
jgi:putative tricarboxylic transport membrane protein